jgi:Fe-S-cluster containining protein
MSEAVFNCRKCGTCCRNLLEYINGVKAGLLLTVKEIDLFPSEMISPKMAIGIAGPEKIISYQLSVDTCPHINEKSECRIYGKRPLMCRAFPYVLEGMSRKCPEIGNQMIASVDLWAIDAEIEASKKINRHVLNRTDKLFRKGKKQKIWEFDLGEKKWVLRKSLC